MNSSQQVWHPAKINNLFMRFSNLSVVIILIITTSVISIAGLILLAVIPDSINYFALKPSNILAGKYLWTLVVHFFSHGNFFHLFINMFVLFSLGSLSERIIGRKRFFLFYITAGIFAGLLSVILSGLLGYGALEKVFGGPATYMVGASGAIFAIAGLFVMLLPKLRFSIIFLPFLSLPAYIMVPLVLIITWVVTIAVGLSIGNVAHFGGFLTGLAYGYYLRLKYQKKVKLLERVFK